MNNNYLKNESIAIVGIGCRFPGDADSPDKFWNNLLNKKDCITPVPVDRWNKDTFYHPDNNTAGKMYVREGGFIKDIKLFDPLFFGISPVESNQIDPQQRILLEVSYLSLEDAGIKLEDISGTNTGVFIGCSGSDYAMIQMSDGGENNLGAHSMPGSINCITANRISYVYNLKGPSLAVDTACASSLYAIHLACGSLRQKESELALCGGVNLILKPQIEIAFNKGGYLSPDCRCKAFDADADGYVRSEGAGMVVLKPLSSALKDGNKIYALIEDSHINQNGRTTGISMPSFSSQVQMLKELYVNRKITIDKIKYIEAHGTGTKAGDPVEVRALGEVIGKKRRSGDELYIGSVKTNIGHLEAGSGIAGLIKAALVMKHKKIPANLHFKNPNPNINFTDLNLKIPMETINLTTEEDFMVGVNSFGFGGANAHIVLKSFPTVTEKTETAEKKQLSSHSQRPSLFILSTHNIESMQNMAGKYISFLLEKNYPLHQIGYNIMKKRSLHDLCYVKAADDKKELLGYLKEIATGNENKNIQRRIVTEKHRIAFIYSGQGSQWWGMGQQLLRTNRLFYEEIARIDSALKDYGWLKNENSSLLKELDKNENQSCMDETRIAQPALFALQVALTRVLEYYGIKAQGVAGHSLGEISAAYVSGAIGFDEALRIVYHRSMCQCQARGLGKMMAVNLTPEQGRQIISGFNGEVVVAAYNNKDMLTLAGTTATLQHLAEQFENKGILHKYINVDIPFHSPILSFIEAPFLNSLGEVNSRAPRIPLYSTVTASPIDSRPMDSKYWADNILKPVLFYQVMNRMVKDGYNTFIEISPHPILSRYIKDTLKDNNKKGNVFGTLRRFTDEEKSILNTVGQLFAWGAEIDPEKIYPDRYPDIDLPVYSWQKGSYWNESRSSLAFRLSAPGHPNLKKKTGFAKESGSFIWDINLDRKSHLFIQDHKVNGTIIYPLAGQIELVLAMVKEHFKTHTFYIEELNSGSPLFLSDSGEKQEIKMEFQNSDFNFYLSSRKDQENPWTIHTSGKINIIDSKLPSPSINIKEITSKMTKDYDINEFYRYIGDLGLELGESFRVIDKLYISDNQHEILTRISVTDNMEFEMSSYSFHPTLLDGLFQGVFLFLMRKAIHNLYLPAHIGQIKFYRPVNGKKIFSYLSKKKLTQKKITIDACIIAEDNTLIAEVKDVELINLNATNHRAYLNNFVYQYTWKEILERDDQNEKTLPDKWLIFADRTGVSDNVCQLLNFKNIIQISAGRHFRAWTPEHLEINPEKNEDFRELFNNINLNPAEKHHLLYLWPFDLHTGSQTTLDSLKRQQPLVTITLVHLIQTLLDANLIHACHLYLITPEVCNINNESESLSLIQSELWGIGRVIQNEYPDLYCRLIDLSSSPPGEELHCLIQNITTKLTDENETEEWAIRKNKLYKRQYQNIDFFNTKVPFNKKKKLPNFRLNIPEAGLLDELEWQEIEFPAVKDDEVIIENSKTALNFRDLMIATHQLNKDAVNTGIFKNKIGIECAGKIIQTGKNVKNFNIGDNVVSYTPHCCRKYVQSHFSRVMIKPARFSESEAAALSIAYLTAYLGLMEKAGLKKGEKILVHNASGGVGMAAMNIARVAGAQIFATAGNEKKRNYLKQAGIKYVYNSRSLDFKTQIREDTNGKGVDVIISSIAGPAVVSNFQCLAFGGRYIEIGKTDIYNHNQINLNLFKKGISYYHIDIDQLSAEDPDYAHVLYKKVFDFIEQNDVPAIPYEEYGIEEVKTAFNRFSKSQHTGKIIIDMKDNPAELFPQSKIQPDKEAYYLITGGTSGFGLSIAAWLARQQAKHLILMSRHGARNNEDLEKIREIEEAGTEVMLHNGDVAEPAAVQKLLEEIDQTGRPLKGIIHAACVYDDQLFLKMHKENFERVIQPKVWGSWNLHEATLNRPLDFFLLLSSVSTIIGNPGQANYSAANSFLDNLALYRRQKGLKATSINWGLIGEVGISARSRKMSEFKKTTGIRELAIIEMELLLEKILTVQPVHIMAADINWSQLNNTSAFARRAYCFKHLMKSGSHTIQNGRYQDFATRIQENTAPDTALNIFMDMIKNNLARIIGIPKEKIKPDIPISTFGIDSLMANQFRLLIKKETNISYPFMRILEGISVIELTESLYKMWNEKNNRGH